MESHQDPAEHADRALEEMEDRRDRLTDRIEETKSDWERKKADDSVPGAGADPDAAEQDSPAKGGGPGPTS
jgi:hypothetical protein